MARWEVTRPNGDVSVVEASSVQADVGGLMFFDVRDNVVAVFAAGHYVSTLKLADEPTLPVYTTSTDPMFIPQLEQD
jgi:hypothetical protein